MAKISRVICVIPAREGSSRTKDKMTREFHDGKSLLELKIIQLKEFAALARLLDIDVQIVVSTGNERLNPSIHKILDKHNINIHIRPDYLVIGHHGSMSDTVKNVTYDLTEQYFSTELEINHLNAEEVFIFWTPAVTPFMTAAHYQLALSLASSNLFEPSQSIAAVNAEREYFWFSEGKEVNYSASKHHPFSQDLKPIYKITNSLYAASLSEMIKNEYFLTPNVKFLELPKIVGVDIDHEIDFKIAQKLAQETNL